MVIKATIGNINHAKKLWLNEFKVHDWKYEDKESMTEKEISIETWDGCNSLSDYDINPDYWKPLNNKVLNAIKVDNPTISVERYRKVGQFDTKICSITSDVAKKKFDTSINISAGHFIRANDIRQRYKLPYNEIKRLKERCAEKVRETMPLLTQEEQKEKTDEMFFDWSLATGHHLGKKDVAKAVLENLNSDLNNVDNKVSVNDDQYSKDIEKMKNGNHEEKNNTVDEPKDL